MVSRRRFSSFAQAAGMARFQANETILTGRRFHITSIKYNKTYANIPNSVIAVNVALKVPAKLLYYLSISHSVLCFKREYHCVQKHLYETWHFSYTQTTTQCCLFSWSSQYCLFSWSYLMSSCHCTCRTLEKTKCKVWQLDLIHVG